VASLGVAGTGNLLPEFRNATHSCNRYGVVASRVTSGTPGSIQNIYPIGSTFTTSGTLQVFDIKFFVVHAYCFHSYIVPERTNNLISTTYVSNIEAKRLNLLRNRQISDECHYYKEFPDNESFWPDVRSGYIIRGQYVISLVKNMLADETRFNLRETGSFTHLTRIFLCISCLQTSEG
jgi:hypothetical protein